VVLLLGLSNGYLASRCMMAAPAAAPPKLREAASTVMVLAVTVGLLVGSFASFGVVRLVTG
jgi:solute carrier family 29 (equilibrative nucleoside transporter), member 1/2/3